MLQNGPEVVVGAMDIPDGDQARVGRLCRQDGTGDSKQSANREAGSQTGSHAFSVPRQGDPGAIMGQPDGGRTIQPG